MRKQVLIAGLVGGIIIFLWGAVSHMALPLGTLGLRNLPNERTVIAAMRNWISEPGMYVFPGIPEGELTEAQEQEWTALYQAGPTGLLVYQPQGGEVLSATQLGTELASDVLAALLAAYVLSQTVGGFGSRVFLCTLLGLFAWLVISVPHWNWYRFPGSFTMAEAIEEAVGWSLAGLALAAIVKPVRGC